MSVQTDDQPRTEKLADACVICTTPLAGALGYAFGMLGIGRSSRNPNLCTRCNTHAEEGRLVELTVLFADISSFTEMTHQLGPERTHEVVDAFLQMATAALIEHQAFIDKYIGDAVMAFFNVPIHSHDHAAQAVAAAEAIMAGLPALQKRFGLDLNASVGIASGWARLGRLGSKDAKDYTAIGDVVNLAARLEGQARAGEILLDRNVYQAVAGSYHEAAEELLMLKGFGEAIPAYRLNTGEGIPRPLGAAGDHAGRALSLGAILFAILGAPCAAATLIGPLAVALGFAGATGAAGVLWGLGDAPIRYPILALATLGALANLYVIWHARGIRARSESTAAQLPIT
ncbi:MAG: adenylate/guanylate cyclase domain-containing protein [Chloroflexi bacterium]|nr:adenylate/guanylate cyclase domain-containing protein [Chloroflexota bacterium]